MQGGCLGFLPSTVFCGFPWFSPVEHTNLSRLNLVDSRTCMLLHSYSWHLSWHKCHRSQEGNIYRLGFFRAGISVMVIAASIWLRICNFAQRVVVSTCFKQKRILVNNHRRSSYIIQFSKWTWGNKQNMKTTMFPRLLLFLVASLVISYLMVARRRSFGKAHSLAIDEGSNVVGMYAYNVNGKLSLLSICL